MKSKLFSILFALVLVLSFTSVTAVPAGASPGGTPTIDGTISAGEWDGAAVFVGANYSAYVLNDTEYLYVAFEANCGDNTIPSSMTNIYIYAGDDYAGECWAYSVAGWVGDVGLDYFAIHHIQPPKVKEGKETRPTTAIVSIAPTVMEWQIPLAEFPMGPGEPLAFDFMSYSESCSSWDTAWLYEQGYLASMPDPAAVLDHFTCYEVKEPKDLPKFEARDVLVTDQFGEEVLTVKKPKYLAVPALKEH